MTEIVSNFYAPTSDEIDNILTRLGNLQLRKVFYSKLINPLWVTALQEKGAFSNPPQLTQSSVGRYQIDPWPEIDYLVRMAPIVPDQVTDVLTVITGSDNPIVRRGLWQAAACLPIHEAVRLVRKMKNWAREDSIANSYVDPGDIARTIVNLLKGCTPENKLGKQLANAYFEPRPTTKKSVPGFSEPRVGMNPYWYSQTLPEVAGLLGGARLKILVRWLEKYQEYAGYFEADTSTYKSYIWRQSVRDGRGVHAYVIGDSLVDAVQNAATDAIRNSIAEFDTLLNSKQPLIRRIALYVLEDAINEAANGSSTRDNTQLTEWQRELATCAESALSNAFYAELECRTEYFPFVQACTSWIGKIDLTAFIKIVEDGPIWLKDSGNFHLAREGEDENQIEKRVKDYLARWQHHLLSAVGKNYLPEKLQTLLSILDSKYGVIDNPQGPAFETTFYFGASSPLDHDTIRDMSDDELINHLRNWPPDLGNLSEPSHDGQGRVLRELVKSQPWRFVDRINDIKSLRPIYIRSILQGWQLAFEANQELRWDSILTVCKWVSNLSDDEQVVDNEDIFNIDPNYRNLKFQTLSFIESGLRVMGSDTNQRISVDIGGFIMDILLTFASHSEPTLDYEEKYGGNNMDPLTLSLNTIRPLAVRALIRLVFSFPGSSVSAAALRMLEDHVGGEDFSTSVAAAVGEGMGRLHISDQAWLEGHASVIFGSAVPTTPKQQVALSTALAAHQYHPAFLGLLRPALLVALKELPTTTHVIGWRGMRSYDQLIGDWIMMAFVSGTISYDDELMNVWFDGANAEVRGEVLGYVGCQLMRWSEVDDKVIARIGDLWDMRASHVAKHSKDFEELLGFYWYVKSEKFGIGWWLPRLLSVSKTITGFRSHGMIGEQLAKAAFIDPGLTLEVVETLLESTRSGDELSDYDIREHAAPQAIASALDTREEPLTKRARNLLNRLGSEGYIDLEQRVLSRRNVVEDA